MKLSNLVLRCMLSRHLRDRMKYGTELLHAIEDMPNKLENAAVIIYKQNKKIKELKLKLYKKDEK